MRNKFFLGVTNDNELAFCEIDIKQRKYWKNEETYFGNLEFSACFDTVRPFKETDVNPVEYFENLIEEMDHEWMLYQLKRLDCRISDLAQELADEINDPRDFLDCSLYEHEYKVKNDYWYFESASCGQHDLRKDGMKMCVNTEIFNEIMEIWDKYHLKEIDEEVVRRVEKIKSILSEIDEKDCIKNWIEEEFYD